MTDITPDEAAAKERVRQAVQASITDMEKILAACIERHPNCSDIQFVGGDQVWVHENSAEHRTNIPISDNLLLRWADAFALRRGGGRELKLGEKGTLEVAQDISGLRLRMTWRRQYGRHGVIALNVRLLPSEPPALSHARFAQNPVPQELVDMVMNHSDGLILFEGPTGSGKRLPLTSIIPTPTGYTTIGQLNVGDTVFGRDGKPCRVTALSPINPTPTLYRLTFSDGQTMVADEGHQWLVSTCDARTAVRRARVTSYIAKRHARLTSYIAQLEALAEEHDAGWVSGEELWGLLGSYELTGEWASAAAICQSLLMTDCPTRSDKATLYPLSTALRHLAQRVREQNFRRGDATAVTEVALVRLSTGEMLEAGLRAVVTGREHVNFAVPLTAALDLPDADLPVEPYAMGACVSSGALNDQRIPLTYPRASHRQRLALLQGFMDTHGTISKDGSCELSVGTRELAEDALELVRSLGIKASWTEPAAPRDGRTRYRITFTTTLPVFRDPRKLERLPAEVGETQQWLHIESIVPVPSEPARCISVDSPDHTYLAGRGFVVTSNSTMQAALVNEVNQTQSRHIYTLEDPIEFVHDSAKSLVTQREIHTDVDSFYQGLQTAKRSKPGIILLGELRDPVTKRAALESAGEGHLVLATSHASAVPEAISTFVGAFPSDEQNDVAQRMAVSLRGVIVQQLIPSTDGRVIPVREMLTVTDVVASKLRDRESGSDLRGVLMSSETRNQKGTFSKDDDLLRLVMTGKVTEQVAVGRAINPSELRARIEAHR